MICEPIAEAIKYTADKLSSDQIFLLAIIWTIEIWLGRTKVIDSGSIPELIFWGIPSWIAKKIFGKASSKPQA